MFGERDPIELRGAPAGHALEILIRRGKVDVEDVAHKLDVRAQILRDIAPAVGSAGPGIPIIRQRNLEMAAEELEMAAELIRQTYKRGLSAQ